MYGNQFGEFARQALGLEDKNKNYTKAEEPHFQQMCTVDEIQSTTSLGI